MEPTLPGRQHVVNDGAPARTPAGDALTDLVMQVVRLIRDFTAVGEGLGGAARPSRAPWRGAGGVAGPPAYAHTPAPRRAKLLRLTPQGRSALRTIQAAQRTWADALAAELGEAD